MMRHFDKGIPLLLILGCGISVELGDPIDRGRDESERGEVIFGWGGHGTMTPSAVAIDPSVGPPPTARPGTVCGFRFEHRGPLAYSHVWASSPTDQWLVRGSHTVEHSDGETTTEVPLPESIASANYWLHRVEGAGREGPFLLVGRWTAGWVRRYNLLRWTGSAWDELPLPPELERPMGGRFDELVILATDDIWAGSESSGGLTVATLFHWDGRTWTPHTFDGSWPFGVGPVGNGEIALAYRRPGETPHTAFRRGSAAGWDPLEPEPDYFTSTPTVPVVFHAAHSGDELYVDAVGRVWDGQVWRWTHIDEGDEGWADIATDGASHHTTVEVGYYDGAFWIVKKGMSVRIWNGAYPTNFTVHPLPFEATDAVFPAEGPPWIVGDEKAFWNGEEWQIQGSTTTRLYDDFLGTVWGVGADDYWMSTNRSAIHAHDGIVEYRNSPPECAAAVVSRPFGLGPDDLFFSTCRGVERFQGGRWDDIVLDLDTRARPWGTDEDHLWAFSRTAKFRFENGRFVPEGAESWLPGSARPSSFLPGDGYNGGAKAIDARGPNDVYVGAIFSSGWSLAHFDGTAWAALPPLPGPQDPFNRPWIMDVHVNEARVWAVGYGHTAPNYAQTRLFSWDGAAWDFVDLQNITTDQWERYIDGRGDDIWVVAADRTIWRRRADGTFERDDRCADAPELFGVKFQGVWFPPDESAPKIFASEGNVLVFDERLE